MLGYFFKLAIISNPTAVVRALQAEEFNSIRRAIELSSQKTPCLFFAYLLHYLNQFGVALLRTVQAVSATLPPLQANKSNWNWSTS